MEQIRRVQCAIIHFGSLPIHLSHLRPLVRLDVQFFGLVVTVPHCRGCTPRGGGSSLRCLACWGPLLAYHDHDHDSGGEDG